MEGLLLKNKNPTDVMIKSIIEIELGYIDTMHPEFVGGIKIPSSLDGGSPDVSLSDHY